MFRRNRNRRIQTRKSTLVYKRTEISEEKKPSRILNILVIFLFLGAVSFIIFSGYFDIKKINVKTSGEVKADVLENEIRNKLNGNILAKNILLFNSSLVEQELKDKFFLKDIQIKKKFFDGLEVQVFEYPTVMIWETGGNKYLVNERGKITELTTGDRSELPLVLDKKNLDVKIGKSIVSPDFIKYIKYLNNNFESLLGKKIERVEVKENIAEIFVYSGLNFYLILDTTRDPEKEVKNIITAVKSLEGKKLTYLDMRIENKAYYK